jgi:hypothetical protein
MHKTRIQVGGTTPKYNPTILVNVSTLSNIMLNASGQVTMAMISGRIF